MESALPFYRQDEALVAAGQALRDAALGEFAGTGLTDQDFAFTWLLPDGTAAPRGVSWRGATPFYPASVAKLFYLVAVEAWLEQGRLGRSDELERAMRDMIVYSSNAASNYLVDLLSGTTDGPALSAAEFADWLEKRHAVNAYFAAWNWPDFAGINVCQKFFDDDRYGREREFAGADGRNHNRLTADATARLLHAIMTGAAVSPERSAHMRGILARGLEPADWRDDPFNQVGGFLGEGLPAGAKLWSKAGLTLWTRHAPASWRRHDAIHVELADRHGGRDFTLAVFTEGRAQAENTRLLPFVAAWVCDRLHAGL